MIIKLIPILFLISCSSQYFRTNYTKNVFNSNINVECVLDTYSGSCNISNLNSIPRGICMNVDFYIKSIDFHKYKTICSGLLNPTSTKIVSFTFDYYKDRCDSSDNCYVEVSYIKQIKPEDGWNLNFNLNQSGE